jgi:hypothetical protein
MTRDQGTRMNAGSEVEIENRVEAGSILILAFCLYPRALIPRHPRSGLIRDRHRRGFAP